MRPRCSGTWAILIRRIRESEHERFRCHDKGAVSRADLLRALAQLLPEREVPGISDTEIHKCLPGETGKQRWASRTNIDAIGRTTYFPADRHGSTG